MDEAQEFLVAGRDLQGGPPEDEVGSLGPGVIRLLGTSADYIAPIDELRLARGLGKAGAAFLQLRLVLSQFPVLGREGVLDRTHMRQHDEREHDHEGIGEGHGRQNPQGQSAARRVRRPAQPADGLALEGAERQDRQIAIRGAVGPLQPDEREIGGDALQIIGVKGAQEDQDMRDLAALPARLEFLLLTEP